MTRSRILLILLLFAVALGAWWFVPRAWLNRPQPDAAKVRITIASGADAPSVADLLERNGLIDSATGYLFYAAIDSSANRPKPGTYAFRPGTNYRSLARTLVIGPEREEVVITLIEGWNLVDDARALETHGVDPNAFLDAARVNSWKRNAPFLEPLKNGTSLEGYLFPDTYRVWKDQLPEGLIAKQLAAFGTRATSIADDAKMQGRTLHDVVILASIVEKEVANPHDRKIVAGIFWNRLRIGMALQSDATVNYVTNAGRTRPTLDDLAIVSPYNTYKNRGLPPGPISNPGADALDAALHPAETEYQYFLTDADGKTYFAKTFEEHQRNRQRAFN